MMSMIRLLGVMMFLLLSTFHTAAQENRPRTYTKENPLVFVDSWNLWPYSYQNADGDPEGYCVDLVKMIMETLDIPYIIRLEPHRKALEDLKAGKADLTLGLSDIYDVQWGLTGRHTIAMLTQSVVTPKKSDVTVKAFNDLMHQQVIVKDSGLCHHLMVDYGWDHHALPTSDIAPAIRQVNKSGKGQIVWNTLSLEWLIKHYELKDVTLTPVDMPFGERKFMARDQQLLDKVDETFQKLRATDQLQPLEQRWIYPDHEAGSTLWIWLLAGGAFLLLVVTIGFLVHELRQNYQLTKSYQRLTQQLHVAAEHNKVRFWTYNVGARTFTWHSDNGTALNTYGADRFARRYSEEDYGRLKETMDRLINRHLDAKGHEETEETLELRAQDREYGDHEMHGFVVHLSVLSRDAHGRPTVLIAAKKDVTKEYHLKLANTELSLRYLSVFYNNESGICFFDKDGFLQNANARAGELLHIDIDDAVMEHVHLDNLFGTMTDSLRDADGKTGTMAVDDSIFTYKMNTVYNEKEQLLGLFVFCI